VPPDASPDARGLPEIGAPLTLSGMVRAAWPLYRSRAPSLVALFLAAYLGTGAIQIAAFSATRTSGSANTDVVLGLVLQFALPAIVGSLATAAAVIVLDAALRGDPTTMSEAVRVLGPLKRELLAAALLAAVLAMLLVLPPLLLLLTYLGAPLLALLLGPQIVIQVITLERLPLRRAWPRARFLLKRNWARALLYLLTVTLAMRLVEQLLLAPALGSIPLLLLLDAIVLGALVPLLQAIAFMVYCDLREQRDRPLQAS